MLTSLVSFTSEANATPAQSCVTVSDETFALRLFHNYIETWIEREVQLRKLRNQRTAWTKRKQLQQTEGKESSHVQQHEVDIANLGDRTERKWNLSVNSCMLWSGKIEPIPKQTRWLKAAEFRNSSRPNANGDGEASCGGLMRSGCKNTSKIGTISWDNVGGYGGKLVS